MSTNVNLTLQNMSEKTLKEVAVSCIIHRFLDQHFMDHCLIHCYSLSYLSKSLVTDTYR